MLKLTEEQKNAVDYLLSFKNQVQTMGGYAGTGKTCVVSYLHKTLGDWDVCAFTGKAANILRKRGIKSASTIHSLIYEAEKNPDGSLATDSYGSPIFVLKGNVDCKGFIVDEASMVSDELFQDLCYFKKPIIFVGDHGQLEPVGRDLNLMEKPDVTLETIHRNAGNIARFAEFIRTGHRPAAFRFQYPENIEFIKQKTMEDRYLDVDQIICAYNKTRVRVNEVVRRKLNYDPAWPVEGEKLMCLRNNRDRGLFNGMQGKLHSFGKAKNHINFYSDYNSFDVYFDPSTLGQEKPEISTNRQDPDPFEYAYCITTHKSQGDEWNKVMVIEQVCKNWNHWRWAYTAASRAKEHLIWAY